MRHAGNRIEGSNPSLSAVNEESSNSYRVFACDLGFLERRARRYKEDAFFIRENYSSGCSPSFHLLSILALELFAKTLIGFEVCKSKDCLTKTEDDIRNGIVREMKRHNHKLDKLYKHFPDLLEKLNIKDIYEFKNDYVWDYRIELKDNKQIILKHIEGIRYGSFAKNRDVMTMCDGDEEIKKLLNEVEGYVEKERERALKIISD